jgi:hypothetical protein
MTKLRQQGMYILPAETAISMVKQDLIDENQV